MIPKKIKIQGQEFEIKFKKEIESGNMNCGSTLPYKNIIWIDSELPKAQQEATLIHEILEVLNQYFELNLEHNKISTLENGLYQALNDNNLLK